ncbi:OB-fold putative lipoprotein [Psychroserpens luteolus]|uniref:OB-fold putative lipoprotein n=1 Tax=Psychroserpens luteolus TaxID=2855840 RepID=UPI001E4EC0E8|nr:OB-fold putative lipoprotein [Psychroserpens luteolus]MCD2260980.1 OB-fold putative lipoprotein [Psychroserpens luteolus]
MIKRHLDKIFVAAFLLISITIITIDLITRSDRNTNEKRTIKQLTTNELIFEYKNQSLGQFIEKAIEVDGILKEIKYKNDIYTLYLTDGNHKTYILCELQSDQIEKIPQLNIGEKVKIKGILKGHLMDVILLNCVII